MGAIFRNKAPRGGAAHQGKGGAGAAISSRLFWFFQFIFWSFITFFSLADSLSEEPIGIVAGKALFLRVSSGFLVTAWVNQLFQAPVLTRLARATRWLLLLVTVTGLLVLSLVPFALLGPDVSQLWVDSKLLGWVLPRMAAGILWTTCRIAIELMEGLYLSEIRLSRAEADAARGEAREIQLEAIASHHEVQRLQAQMNPHFLFNALNVIIACKNDPGQVARVTQDLADFLRGALRESRLLEPLSHEIRMLEKYLGIQQARFGDGLKCRIHCDRAARGVMVPPLMVQPLLENAIAYGMKTSDGPLRVEVAARVTGEILEVAVSNTGRWIPPDAARSPGTGLLILRKRLELLIGSGAVVETECGEPWPETGGSGVRVVVRMPAKVARQPMVGDRVPSVEPAE